MENNNLSGVIVPCITPVDEDDCVVESDFRRALRRLVRSGIHGIFVGGSAGEGPLLTMPEWTRMIEIACDEVQGSVALLGGAIDTSTKRVKEKIRIFAQVGYRYYVVTPTYYITLRTPDEHLRLFGACAEAGPGMEMIAYNIPSCTQSEIPVEVLLDIARRGWIRLCKESSGNFAYFERLVTEGKSVGLRVLEGEEPHIAQGLLAGACGIVPVCANYEPATYIAAYEAALEGDHETLALRQARGLQVRKALLFAGPLWIAGIKYGMSTLGIGNGRPISPLQPLTAAERASIDAFTRDAQEQGFQAA